MEFISKKKFKEQPKTIQKVFLNCWKPSIGDLISINVCTEKGKDEDMIFAINNDSNEVNKLKDTPLLNQGQLIQFLENHGYCIDIESYHSYQITLKKRAKEGKLIIEKRISSTYLLDLIWEMALYVAIEIAKESVKNEQ